MNNDNDQLLPDTKLMLDDAKAAIEAIKKNSKLRIHFLKLIVMNNIMRAFVTLYRLDDEYETGQKDFMKILVDVEARTERSWLLAEKLALDKVYALYDTLLGSATDEQLNEIMEYVDQNRADGRWGVIRTKSGKRK